MIQYLGCTKMMFVGTNNIETYKLSLKRRKVSGVGQLDCTAIPQNFWGCVGAIVACTVNINQGVGILNGSMGVIRDVIYATGENGRDHLPTSIVIDFEDYRGKDLASLLRKI